MKPTDEHQRIIADAALSCFNRRGSTITEVALASIEKWESIRPSTAPGLTDQLAARVNEIEALRAEVATLKASLPEWIPLAERPSRTDGASVDGWRIYLNSHGLTFCGSPTGESDGSNPLTHFLDCAVLAKLPKRQAPTPEEIERAELEAAWAEHSGNAPHGSYYTDFLAGWKAARAK